MDAEEPIEIVAPPAPTSTENLEDAFQNLFKTSASGTGEEELLRIASQFSMQLSSKQIKALLYLEMLVTEGHPRRVWIAEFVERWLTLKRNNDSDMFVMKALEHISLRKFLNENSFKVNIEK